MGTAANIRTVAATTPMNLRRDHTGDLSFFLGIYTCRLLKAKKMYVQLELKLVNLTSETVTWPVATVNYLI